MLDTICVPEKFALSLYEPWTCHAHPSSNICNKVSVTPNDENVEYIFFYINSVMPSFRRRGVELITKQCCLSIRDAYMWKRVNLRRTS